ncbi:hypothetical protein CDAR_365511 [Caerostris darwini]|uniref:Uncharacterized protein n=1 Tax=Caerostris darwini TaxID=1538125 RepID=A0AAV4QE90_9ARAC|nr:hypothetical protein CDAR_365511 [Caerostris darwini]
MLKKYRRKKKRQILAKEREQEESLEQQHRENSPNFKEREEDRRRNSELYDQFEEHERIRNHKMWLVREEQAQNEFRKRKEYQEQRRIKEEEERKRMLAEFELLQEMESKQEEEKKKIQSQKEETLQNALTNLSKDDGPWHNPIAPENYHPGVERPQCQFFAKTGCCRFGDRCSRGHIYPTISTTLLIKGMYSHFSIGHTERDDFDTDNALEYEEKERYQDFKNFYFDVLPEFKKCGKVLQFKVCSNHEPHLRGNVYVQFSNEEETVKAYQQFNGRYYAGKQLTCEFTNVIKWRSAICGLYFRRLCPKGLNCNFLHCFKNPTSEFWEADRDLPVLETSNGSHSRSSHSRHNSERNSSYRSHVSASRRYRRDNTPEYSSSRRYRSDSESDSEEYNNSSRRQDSERRHDSLHKSHRKKKRRRSRSRSRSGTPLSDYTPESSHKKSKKKKKKSKKRKRESSYEKNNSD